MNTRVNGYSNKRLLGKILFFLLLGSGGFSLFLPTTISKLTTGKLAIGELAAREIILNGTKDAFLYYRTRPGETYTKLARQYALIPDRIRAYNGNANLSHKRETLIRLPTQRPHIVRPGDTLTGLSLRYKIPLSELQVWIEQQRQSQYQLQSQSQSQLQPQLQSTQSRRKKNPSSNTTLYVGEKIQIPIHYPDEVWLYSAYIKSQYQRLSEIGESANAAPRTTQKTLSSPQPLISVTADSQRRKRRKDITSPQYPQLHPSLTLRIRESQPFIKSIEEELAFTLPLRGKQWDLKEVSGYNLSAKQFQPGIVYQVRTPTVVRASENGKIVFSEPLRGWGLTLVLRHSETFFTLYSGLAEIHPKLANVGHPVKKGDTLGRINEGLFFALHYQGFPIDPLEFF